MNKRLVSVLAFALLISAVATTVVYRMLSSRIAGASAPSNAQIVVASHDLQLGTLIREADVRTVGWSGPIPKGAATNVAELLNRGVVTMIYEGEAVTDSRLAAKGAGGGLAATIPVGMRAVAVKVNEVVGVAGFVVPGMRVDVIISGTPPTTNNTLGTLSKTVLQNIQVLSAGQKIEKTAEGTPQSVNVVNLLVKPEQAEILSLASTQTQILLVLRNPLDTEEAKTSGTATANLFTGMPFRAPVPPPPPAHRTVAARPKPLPVEPVVAIPEKMLPPVIIEVFHGAKKARSEFRNTSEENN
jgi:pilus assembly protein CpaB